jgi:hypothetical protein
MRKYDRRLVALGVIVVNVVLWSVAMALVASAAGLTKPKYDTTPIQCERELPNSEH